MNNPILYYFPQKFSVGLWWALAGALFIDAVIYCIILYFTNWERQAELANVRVTKGTTSQQEADEKTGT